MKKLLKKIGFIILAVFTGLVLAAVLLPHVFKDELMKALKDMANKEVKATIDFKDANISFLKSFPDVKISIDSISVIGRDTFDGIVLYQAPITSIDLNFASLIGKNSIPQINSVSSINPEINIVLLDSINANYLLSKDSSADKPSYHLLLKSYKISNGKLTYQDNTLSIFAVAENFTHEGNGDFTQDVFDLKTETIIDSFSIKYNGTEYLKRGKVVLKSNININFPEQKYTLLNNVLKVNDLDLTGAGYFQKKDNDIYSDVSFKTNSESFKSFISVLPNAYTHDFQAVKSSGTATISGFVKGLYSDKLNIMPPFDISIKIKDGYLKYPSFSQDVKNIQAGINVKASRPDYKDLAIDINGLQLFVGNDPIKGDLRLENLAGNKNVSGKLNARLNLKTLKDAYPIPDIEELSGILVCDFSFSAKMSDIDAENYQTIKFNGTADANSITYRSKGMPQIFIKKGNCIASPAKLELSANQIKIGKSNMDLGMVVRNPLTIFSPDKSIQADLNIKSDFFDVNEWKVNSKQQESTKAPSALNIEMLKSSGITINLSIKKVQFDEKVIENIVLDGKMAANAIDVKRFSAIIGESDLLITGTIIGVYDYLFLNGILDGKIQLNSNKLNANQFIITSKTKSSSVDSIIPVPERMRMNIDTEIKELIYTNLTLKKFKGNLEVKNSEIVLKNLETYTLGGKLALEGLYSTVDLSNPDFSVKLDLSKINFAEAISKLEMFRKAAPIASYIDGFFNTTLVMKGKLGENMMPDLSSLDASGLLETLSGSIRGLNPMAELAEKIGIKELKEINLTNTKNWFDIIHGFVELKEYSNKINGIDFTISGKHGFGKDMDYNIDLVIPRELLKKNKIISFGEKGLSIIEKEALKLGVNINQGPDIFLSVKMNGTFKKPIFKITPKTSKGEAINNAAETKVKEMINAIEDSLKTEIKRKEAEVKDTITKRANEELEKVKNQATKAAEKAMDSLKAKANDVLINKLDTLSKGAISDSLKQKAKEILNKNADSEVEKIKEKLKDFNPFKKKGNG